MSFEYNRAKELCKSRGISMHELCKNSGVPINTFTKPKRDIGDISIESLQKVCEIGLGITIDQFYEPKSKRTTLTENQKEFLQFLKNSTDKQKHRVFVYARGLAQQRALNGGEVNGAQNKGEHEEQDPC